ncbi:hypothetical protein [Pseudonocardia acidicola]|uniref:hypothetical protein n=1 Tax=Pseudonocardia acidicola TaxID=2724939 RepID=UPI001EF11471|nr:hypothetical protein [Pseudonocardia acidicola]
MTYVVVDGANVVGSRPDGWWRDRAGAAARLAERLDAALRDDPAALAAAVGAVGSPGDLHVPLVLEGAARRAEPRVSDPRLEIVDAPADGDSTIAELARDLTGRGDDVVVVTADRGLRDRIRAAGARAVGPGALLRALPATVH